MGEIRSNDLELGILGGGQLGKMLIEAASNWNIRCHVLDPDPECSCAQLAYNFTCGSFRDFETVYNFGKHLQKITIEIEHVNVDALFRLKAEGREIFPDPEVLKIIQDKGRQKMFFEDNELPSSNFQLIESKEELIQLIQENMISMPFVQKSCTSGYDGKGVSVIKNEGDTDKLLSGECVIEDLVEIEKELSVIAARTHTGEIVCYPVVEMDFHPEANLVELLSAPASITKEQSDLAESIASDTINAFGMTGILAVELFLTKSGEIFINEVAPRPHNSGHHTIEANYTSQYEQLLRCVFGFPPGSTALRNHAVMVNVLGEDGYTGEAVYRGMEACLGKEGVYLHLYGKKITKPFRKMGHVTVIGDDFSSVHETATFIKQNLKVIS